MTVRDIASTTFHAAAVLLVSATAVWCLVRGLQLALGVSNVP